MGRNVKTLQTSMTAGELDPLLAAREDIKYYYEGAEKLRNVFIYPQGGTYRRPGLEYVDTLVGVLSQLTVDSATAPNGGTAANGYDDDESTVVLTTTSIGTTNNYVVFRVDLGSAQTVTFVDLRKFKLTSGSSDQFKVQYSANDVDWTAFNATGSIADVGTTEQSYRVSSYANGYSGVSARYWRLARVGATDLSTAKASLGEMKLWTRDVSSELTISSATAPNGGTAANGYDGDDGTYVEADAPRAGSNYVVFRADLGSSQTVVYVDIRNLYFGGFYSCTSDEFYVEYSTDDTNWYTFAALSTIGYVTSTAKNFLLYYATDPTNGVSARYLRLIRIGTSDIRCTIELGEFKVWNVLPVSEPGRLIPFSYSTEQEYMLVHTGYNVAVYKDGVHQADIYSPISADELPNMNFVQSIDTLILFHKAHQPHKIVRQATDSNWIDAALTLSNIPQYDFGAGDVDMWSDTHGWPQCGTFFEARLWLGGSTDRPQTVAASKVGSFFDFDEGTGLADEAIVATLDTDDVSEIYNIFGSRHLQIFTSSSEFYVLPEADPIQPDNIVIKRTSTIGSSGPGVRMGGVDGASLFLQRGGKAVREMLYTDTEQTYTSQNISLLSSHLLKAPTSLAIRRATSTDEADLVLLANTDGTLPILLTLRSQDITGWVRAETGDLRKSSTDEGYRAIKAVAALLEDIYVIVEYRTQAGVTDRYLERFQADHFLDSSVRETGFNAATLTSLDHLEGESVICYANGINYGAFTVASGEIALGETITGTIEAGLAFPDTKENEVQRLMDYDGMDESEARLLVFGDVSGAGSGDGVWIKDMPVSPRLQDGSLIGELKRCYEIDAVVRNTQHFYVAANGNDAELVQFREMGAAIGTKPPIVTRTVVLDGLIGYDKTGQVEITQRDPGPLTLQALKKKVSI